MLVPKRRAVERLASAKLVSAEGPAEEGRSGTSNSVSVGVVAGRGDAQVVETRSPIVRNAAGSLMLEVTV